VQRADGVVQLVLSKDNSIWFDPAGGSSYTPEFFSQDQLSSSGTGSSSIFTWTDTKGEVTTFHGFDPAIPAPERGQLASYSDAAGNVTSGSYDTSGNLTEITRTSGTGSTALTESYLYSYLTSGVNSGKVSSITLRRKIGSGSYSTVRSVAYTYYDGTTSNGNAGDLELTVVSDGSGNVIDTRYARYYTPTSVTSLVANATTHVVTATASTTGLSVGDYVSVAGATQTQFNGNFVVLSVTGTTFTYQAFGHASGTATGTITYLARGYQGGLKYFFDADSYARLAAAVSSPLSASDASVAPYATNYFEYASDRRVTKEIAQGAGSSASGGLGTFTFAYTPSSNTPGYNSWAVKTVETLPDGNQNIVYSNAYGEQMLKAYKDITSGAQTIDFYSYDSQGRLIMHANPSAVSGYDDTNADLLNYSGGTYQYLRDDTGLIDITDYYSDTTATATTAGDVTGYLEDHQEQEGQQGSLVMQDRQTYFSRTGSSSTYYPVATMTTYGGTYGTDPRTTSYSYTWYSGTVQMQSETVTQPPIVAAQNGPASSTSDTANADTTTQYFDAYGRVIWSRDGGGFLTYTQYDNATGAVIKQIDDVNTADTSDFSSLPSGWTTPTGGGLELITSYQVDALGRTTEETDPDGNVTYTVYNDPGHETRVYPGWHQVGSNWVTTGPIEVSRHYRPAAGASSGQQTVYDETLTSSATPVVSSGVPTGLETIDQTNIQTLSRTLTNNGGQNSEQDDYFSLSGITYGQATAVLGSSSNNSATGNYHQTLYGYDSRGLQNRVQAPTGTITRTVYDGLGRVVSTWVGTNDTPSSGAWSPTNNTSPSNMIDVSDNAYDQRQVGPTTPSLTQDGSDTSTAITYYVKVTYVTPTGESVASSEASISVNGGNQLDVSSPPSVAGATGYNVYASMLLTTPTVPATVFDSAATTGGFLQGGKTYRYEITATTPNGETAGSAEQSYTVPSGTNTNQITLYWNSVPGASGYKIYRTAPNGATSTEKLLSVVTDGSITSYTDTTNPVLTTPVPTTNTTGSGTETLQNTGQISLGTSWDQPTPSALVYGMSVPVNGIGDSDLTQTTQHPGGSAADRTTLNLYDYRDRLIATKQGALLSSGLPNPSGETDAAHRLITYYDIDNLGEILGTHQYAGDGISLNDFENWSSSSTDASSLRAFSSNAYDDQGRVYQSSISSVDPSSGSIGSSLTSNTFYDHRGNVIETANPGGQVSKSSYDGAGRDIKDSLSDGGVINSATQDWTNAGTTANDVVIEQTLNTYDASGNLIKTLTKQRFDNDSTSSTGDLGSPSSGVGARDYYAANYYDAANRLTDSVDVGTNGGSAWTRPSSVPTDSDTVLVTHTDYNAAGWVVDTVDPRGIEAATFYDLLGRAKETISAWDGTGSPSPASSTNQITTYTYDGDGNELTQTAIMPSGTNNQTTAYLYGTSSTSNVFSNDLLVKIEYPNASTGAAGTASSDDQVFTYNALGQKTAFTDQNQTTHNYGYDVLGRLTSDSIPTGGFGTGISNQTWGVAFSYDDAGRPYQQSSYSNSALSTVENQSRELYNGYGQLIQQYQEYAGAVNTSSSASIQYTYSQPSGTNYSRLTAMTYPNGRVLDYGYNTGLDDTISRVSYEADDGGSSSGVHLANYSYLGLGTIVVENEPENNTELTYVHQSGDTLSSSDGGDQYTGLDRFGRVIDQYWLNTSTSTTSDRLQYGYDRDGNVLYEKNLVNGAFSELYHANSGATGDNNTAYDSLNRLTTFRRGTLTSSGNNGSSLDTITSGNLNTTTSVGHTNSWSLDALGNWSSSAPNGSSSSNVFNSKNEETTNGSHTLAFDANGNMTTDEQGQQYVFDAWNHPVQIKNSGGTTIETFSNNATGHVIIENNGAGDDHWYYSDQGQVVEEKYSSSYDQFVWGLGYINNLILRDRNADGNGATGDLGLTGSGLEERYYAQHDANWSTISITGQTGTLVYRYVYDPYGAVISLDPGTWTYSSPGTTYWLYLFQGMRVDGSMDLSQTRWYDPALGRWNQQDPMGYVDGLNLYQAELGNTVVGLDPLGKADQSAPPMKVTSLETSDVKSDWSWQYDLTVKLDPALSAKFAVQSVDVNLSLFKKGQQLANFNQTVDTEFVDVVENQYLDQIKDNGRMKRFANMVSQQQGITLCSATYSASFTLNLYSEVSVKLGHDQQAADTEGWQNWDPSELGTTGGQQIYHTQDKTYGSKSSSIGAQFNAELPKDTANSKLPDEKKRKFFGIRGEGQSLGTIKHTDVLNYDITNGDPVHQKGSVQFDLGSQNAALAERSALYAPR
jgi:RHS repeat-associated protein